MSLVSVSIGELWLAMLAAAAFVFIVSSVIHMATPWHTNDKRTMAAEGEILQGLRTAGLAPGDYMFPGCSGMKEMGTPEMLEKYKQGPVGFLTVLPSGPPAIGKALLQWFTFSLLVSLFTAYVCTLSLNLGSDAMHIFRVSAVVAFMGYSLSDVCNSIWMGIAWGTTFRFLVDGLLYGLATGVAFAWLWPSLS